MADESKATDESKPTDNGRQEAWRNRCAGLEALNVDPFEPEMPTDEDRFLQVQAILNEYEVAIGSVAPVPALPPNWEGSPPITAIDTLPGLAEWLADQWRSTVATEMGGEQYKAMAMEQAAKAVRNGYRVLAWLGVEDRPAPPMPPETVADAKKQIDDLERFVRKKIKDNWQPPKGKPQRGSVVVANPVQRRKRSDKAGLNQLVHQYLNEHPGAPIRDVAKALGWAQGTVQKTVAWRQEQKRRDANKPPLKKTPIQLTDEMLECIPATDNMDEVDAQLDYELDFRRLIELSPPENRGTLNAMPEGQRRALVKAFKAQERDRWPMGD